MTKRLHLAYRVLQIQMQLFSFNIGVRERLEQHCIITFALRLWQISKSECKLVHVQKQVYFHKRLKFLGLHILFERSRYSVLEIVGSTHFLFIHFLSISIFSPLKLDMLFFCNNFQKFCLKLTSPTAKRKACY